jgi:UDP-glucose 4-epimerase
MPDPSTVLVVGGAGYIGSVAVERLIGAGYRVVVYDNLSRGHLNALHPAAVFVKGDLADGALLTQTLRAHVVGAVMHFAALSLVGESMQAPGRYFQNNVGDTITLLEAMVEAGVSRFIFSSSAAVYGDPESVPIREINRLVPVNPYGESKLAVEKMLHWYDRVHGLRYASLRYFNAAGASERFGEDHDPESHLIPLILQTCLGRRPRVEIYGTDYPTPDGTCVRDYIHVVDLADAHILALGALDRGSRVFNLGNGSGYSVRQVISAARRVTGREIPNVEAPRRPGDPPILVASADLAQHELGWHPQFPSIDAIVATAWDWLTRFPAGYLG